MKIEYILDIDCNSEQIEQVSNIIGKPSSEEEFGYNIILTQEDSDSYVDFINYFLDLLENKYEFLKETGIQKKDITIWMYYAYDDQCNMEFEPEDMKRLGENNIKLCITCWRA